MNCKSCKIGTVHTKLNFGEQPPSNRYQVTKNGDHDLHNLEMGICYDCGLLQLIDPMPVEMVRSRFSWIKYNEPEFHLDNLVDELVKLPGINTQSKIVGLTYKDETTLSRFGRKGYTNIHNTTMPESNSPAGSYDGLETIQQVITEERNINLDTEIDLLLVRHVLEHAHEMNAFLKNIAKNVKKDGYLVFEIPDSRKFLQHKNYCFAWEEHIVYFTEVTLRSFFARNNLQVVKIFRYEAALEDSLVAVIRNEPGQKGDGEYDIQKEISEMDVFTKTFPEIKNTHRSFLQNACNEGKKIAVFGAGHLATKYINLFELKDFISCVIDDSKDKENLFMPGSSVQIRNSAFLAEIDICILGLSPESQEKVLKLKKDMIKPGGKFCSAFDNTLRSI